MTSALMLRKPDWTTGPNPGLLLAQCPFPSSFPGRRPRGLLNTFSEEPHTSVRNVVFLGSVDSVEWSAFRVTSSFPTTPCRHSPYRFSTMLPHNAAALLSAEQRQRSPLAPLHPRPFAGEVVQNIRRFGWITSTVKQAMELGFRSLEEPSTWSDIDKFEPREASASKKGRSR